MAKVLPHNEKGDPSIMTSLPCDLGGNVAQLLPAAVPLKTIVRTIAHDASTDITLETDPASLIVITANDYPIWWKWGTGCAGTTGNCHGQCPAEQTIMLVVPQGQTSISFRARTATATLTITEY